MELSAKEKAGTKKIFMILWSVQVAKHKKGGGSTSIKGHWILFRSRHFSEALKEYDKISDGAARLIVWCAHYTSKKL